jgi:hypothetical protein
MAKERYSLIQTDKGKYKPKDKVQFRSAYEGGSPLDCLLRKFPVKSEH